MVIAELSGSHGASRQTVQDFGQSVLGLPISTGGIDRIIDRSSAALKDYYGLYVNWVNKRQMCLAHLIRKAKVLTEMKDESAFASLRITLGVS